MNILEIINNWRVERMHARIEHIVRLNRIDRNGAMAQCLICAEGIRA